VVRTYYETQGKPIYAVREVLDAPPPSLVGPDGRAHAAVRRPAAAARASAREER
jgi:hypothetical protein